MLVTESMFPHSLRVQYHQFVAQFQCLPLKTLTHSSVSSHSKSGGARELLSVSSLCTLLRVHSSRDVAQAKNPQYLVLFCENSEMTVKYDKKVNMKKRLPFPGSMTSQSAVPLLYNALTSYTLLNQGT